MDILLFTVPVPIRPQPVILEDELPAAVVLPTLVDEDWASAQITQYWPQLPVLPILNEGAGSSLRNFYLEQEEPWTAQFEIISWTPICFLDDEITGAHLANVSLEDEIAWIAQFQIGTWLTATFLDDDQVALLGYDDDPSWIASVTSTVWVPVSFLYDETGGVLADYPWEQQDDWNKQVQTVVWTPVSFLDDETGASLKGFGIDDETPWSLPQLQAIVWPASLLPNEEVAAILPLEDGEWSASKSWAVVWSATALYTDDEQFKVFILEDEGLPLQAVSVFWCQVFGLWDDDDDSPTQLPIEQEDDWNRGTQFVFWLNWTFLDDDQLWVKVCPPLPAVIWNQPPALATVIWSVPIPFITQMWNKPNPNAPVVWCPCSC